MRNEKGQALIFVVATMTIALAVGVGVSLRNLSSISRTSRTDTAARAQAAAEGGAENVLSKTEEELAEMVGRPPVEITFSPTLNDQITAVASVTVEQYDIPDELGYFPLEIRRDQVSEVKLSGGSIEICWSSQEEDRGSDIYYVSYNDVGDTSRGGIESNTRTGFPSNYEVANFNSGSGGKDGFDTCGDTDLVDDADGIRIRSINADSRIGIYPSGSLPNQGYLITSIGRLLNLPEGQEAEAKVTVVRSEPYMPGIFDFAIFSGSTGDALE